jgi:hypothetical protein
MLVVEIEMNRQAGVSNRAMAVLPSVVCVRIYNELTPCSSKGMFGHDSSEHCFESIN